MWETTLSSCSGKLQKSSQYNLPYVQNLDCLYLTSGVEFLSSTSVTSGTLASDRVTISMSLTGVRLDLFLQLNIIVNLLLQLMLHLHLREFLVDGHDLRFVELVHSHLGIEANLGTDRFGNMRANTKDVAGKAKMYKLVMLDSFTKDVNNHRWVGTH